MSDPSIIDPSEIRPPPIEDPSELPRDPSEREEKEEKTEYDPSEHYDPSKITEPTPRETVTPEMREVERLQEEIEKVKWRVQPGGWGMTWREFHALQRRLREAQQRALSSLAYGSGKRKKLSLTGKQFAYYYGLDLGIAPGLTITGLKQKGETFTFDLTPLRYEGPLSKRAIESFYGTTFDVPKYATITGLAATDQGIQLEYKLPTAPTIPYTSYMIVTRKEISKPLDPYSSYMTALSKAQSGVLTFATGYLYELEKPKAPHILDPFYMSVAKGQRGKLPYEPGFVYDLKVETITGPTIPYTQYMLGQITPHDIPPDSVILERAITKEGVALTYMSREEWLKLPAYVREGREPTFWEVPLTIHLREGFKGLEEVRSQFWADIMGWSEKERLKYKKGEMIRRYSTVGTFAAESPSLIVGAVKGAESFYGGIELYLGKPTSRSYLSTLSSSLFTTGLQALPIVGEGKVKPDYLQSYGESIKEEPMELFGELVFDFATMQYAYLFGKHVLAPSLSAYYEGLKLAGGKVKATVMKRVFPERYYYSRYIRPAQPIVAGDKEVYRSLAKIGGKWQYITSDTSKYFGGKATTWTTKPWPKPKGFKPTTKPWTPPELLKDVTQYVGRGGTLISKQITKAVTVTTKEQAKALFKVLPSYALAVYQPKIKTQMKETKLAPWMWRGAPYPFITMQKAWASLGVKTKTYPREKEKLRLDLIPKPLLKREELDLLEAQQTQKERQKALAKVTTLTVSGLTQKQQQKLIPPQVQKLTVSQVQKQEFKQLLRRETRQKTQQIQQQISRQAQAQKQVQIQRLLQKQQRLRRRYKVEWPKFAQRRRKDLLFGQWYKKKHRIATPKQLLSLVGGFSRSRNRSPKQFNKRVKALIGGR